MAEVDFSNQQQMQDWFSDRSLERRCEIVTRAVLRILPFEPAVEIYFDKTVLLRVLRCLLTSYCRSLALEEERAELSNACRSAWSSLRQSEAQKPHTPSTTAAFLSARTGYQSFPDEDSPSAATQALFEAYSVASASRLTDKAIQAVRQDSEVGSGELVALPLWGNSSL